MSALSEIEKEAERQKIEKLPKWAQEKIRDLERERETAINALREWTDSQTASPISIPEMACLGKRPGPSHLNRYVHSRQIEFDYKGVKLTVLLAESGQRMPGIHLQWQMSEDRIGCVAMVPTSFQAVSLIAKENLDR